MIHDQCVGENGKPAPCTALEWGEAERNLVKDNSCLIPHCRGWLYSRVGFVKNDREERVAEFAAKDKRLGYTYPALTKLSLITLG